MITQGAWVLPVVIVGIEASAARWFFHAIDPAAAHPRSNIISMTVSTQIFLSAPVDARDGARPWGLG
ncbi:hypothetical protein [Bradyrhizobium japonicum]|uniref:hypothetical protein n=1 Tax=Bradyrhizobium japonicum TaxID=375 RepID=UPI001E3C9A4A|nr:hypothetical protein [Bradyrhizobium japonicum]MCD9893236.1 hypothetical protein [Bradyrhizobium japonicum]WRJ83865.1 hypothetical protein R3F78_02770 [Bradyrhizobium japonicum]WRJ92845.1 hypothetical protein R3F77_00530 [Bradyrhizobium japonicum]WRK46687.1 hypothetical protein R3F73_00540 [Bradyrhizobium japonicum]